MNFIKQIISLPSNILNQSIKTATKTEEILFNPENQLSCTLYKNINLKNHQLVICHKVINDDIRGLLLFHSVGSGKTLTIITLMRCLLKNNPSQVFYIITPKSLVENFKKEMNKVNIEITDNINISTYQFFISKIQENKKLCENAILIIDEAHNFTKLYGKRVKEVMKCTSIAKKVFLLTATPIQNKPQEFTNLFAMISENEKNIGKYAEIFQSNDENAISHLLKNKISYFKNNDTQNYPSVTYNIISLVMPYDYFKIYSSIVYEDRKNITSEYFLKTKDLITFANGGRRASNFIDDKIQTPKIVWITNFILKSIKKGEKTLIYSSFKRAGIHFIQETLSKYDIKWVHVTGDMSIIDRNKSVELYNNDKVSILLITAAGGEGLDLKGTSNCILLEPHWNNERIRQVIGRAVRFQSHSHLPEKQRHVNVYRLILDTPMFRWASTDRIMYNFSNQKDAIINKFYNILIDNSIENTKL